MPATSKRSRSRGRALLYIDMAYSLDELHRRGHLEFFEARHSGGYFDKVIGLHPLADRVVSVEAAMERKPFSKRQEIIEAKSAAVGLPRWLAPVDVFVTQRRLLREVVRIVREEKIAVIAATDPLYAGLFGLCIKRHTGVPLALHLVANYDLNYEATGSLAMPRMFPSRPIEKAVIKYVLRRADLVAAGSETLREYAVTQGARRENTEVFRVAKNMVAAHRVPPGERPPLSADERERLGIDDSAKLLLTVARLEPVKMVDHSIQAFAIVAREHPNALLLLAGEGSQRQALEQLALELGVADRVRFLGLVDQELLARLEPHCLTLSPLTGMALFETSMAGSPAVAYDCDSAVTEMIETGVTGVLVEREDWAALGHEASRLLGDPELYGRMSRAIRARAESLTDENVLYANEHVAYERLLRV